MNGPTRASLLLLGLLAATCVALLAGILEVIQSSRPGLRFEPGRGQQATLNDHDLERLASFDEPIRLTYYVTERGELPAHLKHLEDNVRDVLSAFRAAAVSLQANVVYPGAHPEWSSALASTGLAPWSARRVEDDGYRVDRLWSSLRIGYGARPAAVLNGVGTGEVRKLQGLILAQLEELREPRRPRIGLSAPAGYDRLRELLRSGAEVHELEFNRHAKLPDDLDLFLWLEPAEASEAHLAALDKLRMRGGSAVLAGHSIDSTESAQHETIGVKFEEHSGAMESLLQHHGLIPVPGLLLDPSAGQGRLPSPTSGQDIVRFLPWFVRATGNRQDFRGMRGQPNGGLLFKTPSAFVPDANRLADMGLRATVLVSSSQAATTHEIPGPALGLDDVNALRGHPQPNVALAAILQPDDPWAGRVLAFADSAVFGDAHWEDEHYAHQRLVQVLLTSLLASERMVAAQVAQTRPEVLPEFSPEERLWMRGLVVLLIPALLGFALALRRRTPGGRAAAGRPWRIVLAGGLVGLPLASLLPGLLRGVEIDWTRDSDNRLSDAKLAIFEGLLPEETELELIFSPPSQLPPEFKPLVRDLRRTCERLAEHLETLTVVTRGVGAPEPSDVPRHAVSTLQAEGVRSFNLLASVVLKRGDLRRVVSFPTERSFRHLHFRMAHGLETLASREQTKIAMFAAPARLSPAEATLEYQGKGLLAPREGDPFSACEDLLEEFDFHTQRLEAGHDDIPRDTGAVFWLQPRRDVLPMAAQLSRWLASGGSALIAGQHFRLVARQLETTGLELRYWPEPQYLDLESVYLPLLGIEMRREVVLDASHGSMGWPTRMDSPGGERTDSVLPVSEPFVVQGSSPIASERHEQWQLPLPTALRWDEQQLAQAGLRASIWIQGGEKHWTYRWRGGDLPAELFEDDPAPQEVEEDIERLDGPACYAALFTGSFPPAEWQQAPSPHLELGPPEPEQPEGQLLLLGSSEMLRNGRLTDADHDHEDFVLRSAATLCLPGELLPLLVERRREAVLGPLEDHTRTRWRWIVLTGTPGLLLLAGLLRRRRL